MVNTDLGCKKHFGCVAVLFVFPANVVLYRALMGGSVANCGYQKASAIHLLSSPLRARQTTKNTSHDRTRIKRPTTHRSTNLRKHEF